MAEKANDLALVSLVDSQSSSMPQGWMQAPGMVGPASIIGTPASRLPVDIPMSGRVCKSSVL